MAGFITILGLIDAVYSLQINSGWVDYINQFLFTLAIGLIAFIGALIVVRQGSHRVGWLMMAVALGGALQVFYDPILLVSLIPVPPPQLNLGLWLLLWIHSFYWLLQMIPIFLIVLYFPDGNPPSPRWNWLIPVALTTLFLGALSHMFNGQIGLINGAWAVDNPIGLFSTGVFQGVSLLWTMGLFVLGGGSLASLFVRYRQGGSVLRTQIKWLLFAGALLIAVVGAFIVYMSFNQEATELPPWLNVLFQIAILVFPLAIGNAIVRYRLYDIDILIRRTLQYTLLTGLLVLTYFGGIITLQGILVPLTGESNSSLVTVITTLGIAALFNPLRRRVQEFIDRRFFRKKYDAEIALNRFAVLARDEVDLERLSGVLLFLVDEAMQPDHTNLWLRQEQR